MNFDIALEEIEKHAGLLDAIKGVALKEIPGTKPWFIGAKAPVSNSLRTSGKLMSPGASGVRRAVTQRTANGAYDVSALAQQMGIK